MRIIHSSKFARQYRKLPTYLQEIAEGKGEIFKSDPFDPRLKTHRLSGDLSGYYAFSITRSIRIIFEKHNEYVVFIRIGNHDIYD